MQKPIDFSPVLNSKFHISHLVIKAGYDTPEHFVCTSGIRPWSRFFCLQSGEARFETCDGRTFLVSAGDILYLPHDVTYTSSWTQKENGWYYSIEFILSSEHESVINFSNDLQIICRNADNAFVKIVRDMHAAWNNGAPGYWMRCYELFMHFLQLLVEINKHNTFDHSLETIYEGISYLENNYTKDITTEQLADLCNMSESNFRRLFHRYSTLSPITYRNFLRMKHARELLETGLYTVSESASMVNITDPFYFNKMFKKYFGTSPRNVIP